MDNNNNGGDDSNRKQPPKPRAQDQDASSSTQNQDQDTPNPSVPILPSFSELMRSIQRSNRLQAATNSPPASRTQNTAADGGLRLTPVFSRRPPITSQSRERLHAVTRSPTRVAPSRESTASTLRPHTLGPPTVASRPESTAAALRSTGPPVMTRPIIPYALPTQQASSPGPAHSPVESTSRSYQFYLVDRASPRTYRACSNCRIRKVKCETDTGQNRCRRCIERGLNCSEAIPISPLVGTLLSTDKDPAPQVIQNRKHRSESDPNLSR